MLSGKVRPSALRLVGARLAVRRDAEGRIDLQFGGTSGPGPKSLGEVLDFEDLQSALGHLVATRPQAIC